MAPESYLARLAAATGAMSPDERAQHLEADAELEVAHTEVENDQPPQRAPDCRC